MKTKKIDQRFKFGHIANKVHPKLFMTTLKLLRLTKYSKQPIAPYIKLIIKTGYLSN